MRYLFYQKKKGKARGKIFFIAIVSTGKKNEKGFRVIPRDVPPFDYVRKRGSGFNRFRWFNGGGAAHKNQKRREGLKLAVFSYRKPNP